MSTTITARFRRLGSEAQAADRAAGHVGPITDADLASALAGHHADDLDALGVEERAEAVAALVEGYRRGG